MKGLYKTEQILKIEEETKQEAGIPEMVLMERAALQVADLICSRYERTKRVLCLCGCGNNGGDGVAVARILYERGWQVSYTIVGNQEKMTPALKSQVETARVSNVRYKEFEYICQQDDGYDIVVDALFGTGISREIGGVFLQAIQWAVGQTEHIVSVDIPSGVSGDTGQIMGTAVKAEVTVTVGVNKPGLILYPGRSYAGEVKLVDIGYPSALVDKVTPFAYYYEKEDIRKKLPPRPAYSNKGTFGKVLVAAGSETMCGACLMAAAAAYKMGAGLVRVCTVKENREVIFGRLPEAVFTTREELEEGLAWADAVVAGPGLGRSDEALSFMNRLLEQNKKPLVIDGDGIYLARQCKRKLPSGTIITPHLKELEGFAEVSVIGHPEKLPQIVSGLAADQGIIVVGKDAKTVVSNGQECYINDAGNNGMATGGSGDVLAGMTAGLLAQKMDSFEAAKLAVYLHGAAGDVMKEKKSSYSLLATDLLEGISELLSNLEA